MIAHMLNKSSIARPGRKPQLARASVVPNAFNRRHRRAGYPFQGMGTFAPSIMDLSPLADIFDMSPSQVLEAEQLMGIERARAMPVDFVEDSQGFQIKADIPGVQKQDIRLDVDHNVLTISAKRSSENSDASKSTSETSDSSSQVVDEHGQSVAVQNDSVKVAEGERNVLRSERYNTFQSRSFRVPKTADLSSISAKYDNGVLTVYINKREDVLEQKRTINIH